MKAPAAIDKKENQRETSRRNITKYMLKSLHTGACRGANSHEKYLSGEMFR